MSTKEQVLQFSNVRIYQDGTEVHCTFDLLPNGNNGIHINYHEEDKGKAKKGEPKSLAVASTGGIVVLQADDESFLVGDPIVTEDGITFGPLQINIAAFRRALGAKGMGAQSLRKVLAPKPGRNIPQSAKRS